MTDSPMTPPQPAPDQLIGRVLAFRYRILSCLGEGAMGAVYLAEHIRIGRRDAIKLLHPDLAKDAEALARFVRGARNVSAISHPNVCAIYDFGVAEEGLQYLAMEYVAGETLRQTLEREGPLPPERALRIAIQVARGLQAAHDAQIVHRDLKPANIMIAPGTDGADLVKVVDFDIAKGADPPPDGEELTRAGLVVGTPVYMSPEQLMGDRLDGRSDIYALGVVLFRMLTGELPFRAASAHEILAQRLTRAPYRLADVVPAVQFPARLDDILARAQAGERDARYPDAASLARDLEEVLATLTSPGRPAAAAVPMSPEALPPTLVVPGPAGGGGRRGRRALIAAVATLVILAGAGAGVLLPRDGGDGGGRGELNDGGGETTQGDSDAGVNRRVPALPGGRRDGRQQFRADATGPAGSGGVASAALPAADSPAAAPPASVAASPVPPQERGAAASTAPRVPPPPDPFEPLRPLLARQEALLDRSPGPAVLAAVRDSVERAWHRSGTRADSSYAAVLLATAALEAGDRGECRRWAERASSLGAGGMAVLLDTCR